MPTLHCGNAFLAPMHSYRDLVTSVRIERLYRPELMVNTFSDDWFLNARSRMKNMTLAALLFSVASICKLGLSLPRAYSRAEWDDQC